MIKEDEMKSFLRELFNLDHVINCKTCRLELSRNNAVVNSYHWEKNLNQKGKYWCKKCSKEDFINNINQQNTKG